MERWTTLKLITQKFDITPIGEQTVNETIAEVYGLISSVSSNEWFSAQRNEINSRYKVLIHQFEYNAQSLCEMDGVRYKIYRTYEVGVDHIELYLCEKVGE